MFLRIMLMLAMVGALSAVGFVLLGNNSKTTTAEAAPVPMTGKSILVATRSLAPWGVYAGSPAVKVKERNRH